MYEWDIRNERVMLGMGLPNEMRPLGRSRQHGEDTIKLDLGSWVETAFELG